MCVKTNYILVAELSYTKKVDLWKGRSRVDVGSRACWLAGDWYKCQRMRGEWENIYSHLLFGFWAIEKEVEKGGGWEYKSGGGRGSVGESGRTLVGHLRCSSQTRVSVSQQEPPSPHIYLYTSYILHITKYNCIMLSLTRKLLIINQVSALFLFLLFSQFSFGS